MKDYKAESSRYFDALAPRYDQHYYGRHGREQYQRVVDASRGWAFGSVLDVGCGSGGLLALLNRPGVGLLAGVDISPNMIEEAKRRLGTGADLKVGDSEKLPWEATSFDLVVSTDSLHHWPNPVQAFSGLLGGGDREDAERCWVRRKQAGTRQFHVGGCERKSSRVRNHKFAFVFGGWLHDAAFDQSFAAR